MNFAKFLQGIVAGAMFSGLLSAICAAYIAFTSDTTDSLGLRAKDFWWLAMLYAGFFGFIASGILGGLISALNLSAVTAGICGLIITAILGVILFLLSSAKQIDENFSRFGFCFIVITILTGVFVFYSQATFFKSE